MTKQNKKTSNMTNEDKKEVLNAATDLKQVRSFLHQLTDANTSDILKIENFITNKDIVIRIYQSLINEMYKLEDDCAVNLNIYLKR